MIGMFTEPKLTLQGEIIVVRQIGNLSINKKSKILRIKSQ